LYTPQVVQPILLNVRHFARHLAAEMILDQLPLALSGIATNDPTCLEGTAQRGFWNAA
jgi:hypothetical protein